MSENTLNAQHRGEYGKGAARKLRAKGLIPGVYYLHNEVNIPFSVSQIALNRLMRRRHPLINLVIESQRPRECVIRELQRDPVSEAIIHIDLQGFREGERITLTVPIKLTGTPVGAKEGGILERGIVEASIDCQPKDITDHIEVDVSGLALGHTIHISDLHFPQFKFHHDPHTVVAHVAAPTIMKERAVAPAEAVPTEGETKTEGKSEEKK